MLNLQTKCCIAGGGPAGIILGYLLARAGVDTIVLEKHGDFLRDFRGDTVHPSTLDVVAELGLLDEFLQRPHTKLREIRGQIGGREYRIADFSHTPTRCHYIAFMPQWDFLNFFADHGAKLPAFHLHMRSDVTDLIEENGRVVGVKAQSPDGPMEIRADLVVGADGRHSTVRERAGLQVINLGAPIDVLWMRISKRASDPPQSLGRLNYGRVLVMLDRGDYWQCAYLIRKGAFESIQSHGIEHLRDEIARIAPFSRERLSEIRTLDDVSLLTVVVDRLKQWWRPGLLCIGDSAHAMSPIGGVGINLAIQDAVAAANILAEPLRNGTISERHLQAVQDRRTFPTRMTQGMQILIQRQVFDRIIGVDRPMKAPWIVRLADQIPWLRRIPARIIGVGFRPEHVRTTRYD